MTNHLAEPSPAESTIPAPRASRERLSFPLVILTLLAPLTLAVDLLLLQPPAYWLDPRQTTGEWYAPLLAGGPLLFGLGVFLYLLVLGLLLARLPRVPALALACVLLVFHFEMLFWQTYETLPSTLRLNLMTSEVFLWVLLIPAGWALWRSTGQMFGRGQARAWEKALGWGALAGWVIFLAAALAVTITPVLRSQSAADGWRPLAPAHLPSRRSYPAVAYDPVRQQAVLFGGVTPSTQTESAGKWVYLRDTWVWDGEDWTQVFPEGEIPAARYSAAFGYDAARGVMILYGGRSKNGELNDIWEWNGSRWRKLCPQCNPAERMGSLMLYDPQTEKLMVYGGISGDDEETEWFTEGWYWDGEAWGSVFFENNAPAATQFGGVYEEARKRALFFFSQKAGGTWTFSSDTATWTPLKPPVEPEHFFGTTMAYDPVSTQSILFGGLADDKKYSNETWVFDGAAWRKLALPLAPGRRAGATLFYDARRGSILLFGGLDRTDYFGDLWELRLPAQ